MDASASVHVEANSPETAFEEVSLSRCPKAVNVFAPVKGTRRSQGLRKNLR
jgi:hypothetical protein